MLGGQARRYRGFGVDSEGRGGVLDKGYNRSGTLGKVGIQITIEVNLPFSSEIV